MTVAELIELLKAFDQDAEVHVMVWDEDLKGGPAHEVVLNKFTGDVSIESNG